MYDPSQHVRVACEELLSVKGGFLGELCAGPGLLWHYPNSTERAQVDALGSLRENINPPRAQYACGWWGRSPVSAGAGPPKPEVLYGGSGVNHSRLSIPWS